MKTTTFQLMLAGSLLAGGLTVLAQDPAAPPPPLPPPAQNEDEAMPPPPPRAEEDAPPFPPNHASPPPAGGNRQGPNAQAPEGMRGPMGPPPTAGRQGPGDGAQRIIERLRQENPTEFARLTELRAKNPEQFRKELRAMMDVKVFKGRQTDEDKACLELAVRYRAAKETADKDTLRAELKTAIAKAYEKRLANQRERLADLEKQLARIREQVKQREADRDTICAKRLEELTRDARYSWNGE
jgi:hypothetical protein